MALDKPNYGQAVVREVASVLEGETLARAPSQSRILAYLGEVAAQGGSAGTTQYAIAMDALGKGEQFDEATDSSVRVQIGRLRKSLRDHYRLNQPADGNYLYIRSGEYRLRLGSLHIAYPELARGPTDATAPRFARPEGEPDFAAARPVPGGEARWRIFTGGRPRYAIAVLIAVSVAAAAYMLLPSPSRSPAEPVLVAAPVIEKELRIVGNLRRDLEARGLVEVIENDIDMLLQKSMMSRTSLDESADRDSFRLLVSIMPTDAGTIEVFTSLRDNQGTLISENSHQVDGLDRLKDAVSDEVIGMISPASQLGFYLSDRIAGQPGSAFECFIAIETFRSEGNRDLPLLDYCAENFGEGPFEAYFAARLVARSVQELRLRGETISEDSPEWARMSEILAEHPQDTFANTVAAKILIGMGDCDAAYEFASRALSRGKTYPMFELTIIVDSYGCEDTGGLRAMWDRRLERLAQIKSERRSPLLEAYLLIGSIAADKEGIVSGRTRRKFSGGNGPYLANLNRALGRYLSGRFTEGDLRSIRASLPLLIWNDQTVAMIEAKLAARAAS